MGVLLLILAALFVALIVIVPLVEKYGKNYSKEEIQKMGRWILPLCALMLVIQLIALAFRG